MHAIIVSIIHVSFGVSSLCCVNPYNPVFITNQTLVSFSYCYIWVVRVFLSLLVSWYLWHTIPDSLCFQYQSDFGSFSLYYVSSHYCIWVTYFFFSFWFLTQWEPRRIEMEPIASSAWRGVRRLCGMYKFTTNPSFGWDVNKTEVPCWEIATLFAR